VEGCAEDLAREVSSLVSCPTIGIGASSACDGQILVIDDMLGMFEQTPRFVRRYADLRGELDRAAAAYAADVRARRFPGEKETYSMKRPQCAPPS
jgi:3-methyl-2-oxobutanoate hydroxymethyltransferase